MKKIPSYDEFLNESNWKETRGVVEFKIRNTTYTLYRNVPKTGEFELYKFDDDNGPLILRLSIEGGKMIISYAGFDSDAVSRTFIDDIIESLFGYFGIVSDGKGIKSKSIILKD